uniref:Uncharacterized protein n=1 Tax=Nelumbo nucifera TaxID=4432 RepID=A0A822Z1B2_NELNU|nr:TPA_asm: hypothetical protein HUJ06_008102 [Nelumbo nucifera]
MSNNLLRFSGATFAIFASGSKKNLLLLLRANSDCIRIKGKFLVRFLCRTMEKSKPKELESQVPQKDIPKEDKH